jgi:NAD(P)-dependent dehydrogenase (short-subunit alcohol dehydrogenase family)
MTLFAGKVALVTGGSSGIGQATAVAFAREGAKVVVGDLNVEGGEETIKLIQASGSDGLFVKTDVAREVDVKMLVETTVATYGRLDYACNNAGIEELPSPLTEQTEDTFDKIINVNVKGVWLGMKYQIPQMLQNGGGAIVNISSAAGLVGFPGLPIYSASKHAVIGLTKCIALEYAKSGIRVNSICPGAIQTPMLTNVSKASPEIVEGAVQMHPLGRIGQPEEIADGVVWLCSDKAAFITGHTLVIDGGYVIQ